MNRLRDELADNGFSVVPGVLGFRETEDLKVALASVTQTNAVRRRGEIYAIRDLLGACPAVRSLAESRQIRFLATAILGADSFPVRALLFDKTTDANWLVPWHQDMTICVAEKHEVAGYRPWSIKAGRWHVQPPKAVLDQMLSVRVHLDNCDESNGALSVVPGTHKFGRLSAESIRYAVENECNFSL